VYQDFSRRVLSVKVKNIEVAHSNQHQELLLNFFQLHGYQEHDYLPQK
jgi:hypothetical protein